MCVLCDKRLYKKDLIIFNENDWENDTERLMFQLHKKNICHRCHETLKKRGKNNESMKADIFGKKHS